MIKVVASYNVNGKRKTCSFQTKEHRPITMKDLERIEKFILTSLDNFCPVEVSYKIDYEGKRGFIAGMSSKTIIAFHERMERQLHHMIDSINNNL